MKTTILMIIILSVLLSSCTKEVAKVDFTQQTTSAIKINATKDHQIDFYLNCDIEYTQKPVMVMDFEFYQGKKQILKGGLNPLAAFPIEKESKITIEGKTRWKFYGKLEGNFIPPQDTVFTIIPTLIYNHHPDLKIYQFDLILVE